MRSAISLIQPVSGDNTIYIPSYTNKFYRVGTVDITNNGAASAYDISAIVASYSTAQGTYPGTIPYYEFYVNPYKLFVNEPDYGYIRDGIGGSAIRVNSGHILAYNQTSFYSAKNSEDPNTVYAIGPQDGSKWFLVKKESVAEIDRKITLTNVNEPDVIGTSTLAEVLQVNIRGLSTSFAVAAGETANFIYSHSGWLMTTSY
jgi:hypothetical protein